MFQWLLCLWESINDYHVYFKAYLYSLVHFCSPSLFQSSNFDWRVAPTSSSKDGAGLWRAAGGGGVGVKAGVGGEGAVGQQRESWPSGASYTYTRDQSCEFKWTPTPAQISHAEIKTTTL